MRYIRLLTPFVIVILVISVSLVYGQATVSSSAAGGWDAPTPISDPTWDYPRFLSMNDDATCVTALLPYSGSGDNNRHVVVKELVGGVWQPSTVIAENGRFSQDPFQWMPQYTHPVMSGDGSTIAYVGWTGETFGVYIVDRLPGGGWSAPTLLNTGLANVHYWISLSQDGKTLALASYSFFGVDHVYVTTRSVEGWSVLTCVSAESGPLEGGGMPALSGDGQKLVYIQNARVTFVQRVNGQWSQPVQITQNNHWEGDSVDYPQLSRDGRAVFYWLVHLNGSVMQNQNLHILRWNGSGWSAPQQVNTGPVIPITDVSRQPAAADRQATRLIFSRPITISEPDMGDVVIASHLEMAEWRGDDVWQESRLIEAEGVYNH
jgi:hypothetical protein